MKENATLKGLVRPDLANSSAASNLAFNEQVKALIRSGRKVYHFAFGQSPFPIPECMTKAVQEYAHVHDYLPMVGIPELREELVKFHARYDNLSLSSDNFTVGPGSKELIFLVMATFNGDILLPAPTWTTYMAQCRLAGKEPRVLEMKQAKGWKLAPETLEEAARQGGDGWKLLVLTSPGNPSTCYTDDELDALSSVCRQQRIIVLSDEIYARLTFSRKHASMAMHYPEGTILISGFSKWASAGGWRLGYAHFPPSLRPLLEAVRNAASHTYSCAPAPMQYGVAKALRENGNELDKYMTNCAKILQAAGDYCHRELASVGVDGCRSQAGYYFVPDFEVVREGLRARGLTTGDHMTQAMLEEADVALMSTHPFLRPAEELTTRFCFVCFDGCSALRALDDLPSPSHHLSDDFLHKHCLPIVQGIQNLKEWVLKYRQE
ncbi:aspartate aminotransferase-like isoform X2 [Homarus americanus]|uniref:aspartate aminotransferase-like isoform X2 n=1 Tax=Homarus americanus TaxID=6706 RepID=UPI001C46602E|nr:aspartate aminotransferase-like isoform X2 [Homarus americanus]